MANDAMFEEKKLRNGSTESQMIIVSTMVTLQSLFKEQAMALYDLVHYAMDDTYDIFPPCRTILEAHAMIKSFGMHDSIRNVVLSAFRVDADGKIFMQSPYAEDENKQGGGCSHEATAASRAG